MAIHRPKNPLALALLSCALLGTVHADVLYTSAGPHLVSDNNAFVLPGLSLSRGATATGTLYFKYTVTNPASNNTTEPYYAGMSFYDLGSEHLGIGNGWDPYAYSAFSGGLPGGNLDLKSATPEPGQTYQEVRSSDVTTFVFRVDFNSGGNDNVTVWLNPNLALSEAAQNPALTTTFTADANFDTIYLREGGNNGSGWTFGNIAIAENATDAGFFAAPPAVTTFVWDGGGSNNLWSTAANWQGDTVAAGAGNIATFPQAAAAAVTLDSARVIGGLGFSGANHSLTGTAALTLDVAFGTPAIDVATGVTATISAPLTGPDGLAKTGAGNLLVSTAPAYTGATRIEGGRLTFSGNVGTPPPTSPALTYSLAAGNENWPADKRASVVAAMDEAVAIYNRYASFNRSLIANYDAGVPTAQAGYGGWIDFGGSIDARTALHEMSHTMGVGTYGAWDSNRAGGVWTGANGVAMIQKLDGPGASIGCDAAHFWPYGLNFGNEDGTVNRMRHVQVISAMRQDMGIVSSSELHGYDGTFDIASGAELEFGGNAVQINSPITGGGALLYSGAGTLKLPAANSHGGGTTVSGGTLVVDATGSLGGGSLTVQTGATCEIRNTSGAIADSADVSLNGTGKLFLAPGLTETVKRLFINGVLQPPGIYTNASPFIIGSGSLVVTEGDPTQTIYYVDPAGNDSNPGISPAMPWQSLGKVNGTVFQPGNKILFKRGGTWVGTLSPQGSGNSSARITLGAYGEGAKPLINGNGGWAGITLSTQSYWTIDGFEVTNPANNDSSRSGIRVDASGSGTMRGIQILNNDVHDVRGIKNVNNGGRNNGGIFFWINEPGKADDVLIQGNTVKTIHGQGIAFNAEAEYAGGGMNYANCSPNVVARGNTVLTTSGDGILMLGTDNELVEHNEVGYVGQLSDNGNNIAAAWPTRHVNGLWQYNHVHHTVWLGANDSTAFDNDGFVKGTTVFQHNYTHDNAGGFLMEYTWGGDDSAQTIARYNISWNESRILASNRNNARIYNNVFYNPGATIDVTWTANPSYILFQNNLFVAAGRTADFSRQLFVNNSFSGGVDWPANFDGNVVRDPLFVSPNTSGNLAGFILQAGSPERNAGFVIVGNGGLDFWGATLPATAPHRGASQINSIANYTATPTFMQVSGPYSAAVPFSGTSTVNFSGTVRDQKFHAISGAAVSWSVSPALAGYSINSSGVLTLSAGAQPQRVAIVAQSGSATATFSFTTLPAVAPVVGSSWINPAGGEWSVAGNWQGNAIANGTDQTATVALFTGVSINQGDASRSIGHLDFSNANHTLQGNPLTLDVTSGAPTISVAGSSLSNISAALIGNDGLLKTGTGTLVLGATNLFSGNTTVNEGILVVSPTGKLYSGGYTASPVVTVNAGATLRLNGWSWDAAGSLANLDYGRDRLVVNGGTLEYSGGSNFNPGDPGSSGRNLTIGAGGATLKSSTASGDTWTISSGSGNLVNNGTLTLDGAGNGVLDKVIEGAGSLVKSGTGIWTLTAGNTYGGPTTVGAGTLRLGNGTNNSNLADGADVSIAAGAALHLNYSGTDTIDELHLGGVAQAPGVYSSANSGGFLTGTGTLTVTTGPVPDYDAWKTANNVTGGPDADDDHDGQSNRFEYAFGQNPAVSSGNPVAFLSPGSAPQLSYLRRKRSLTGLAYKVWTSPNLTVWTEDTGAVQTATAIPASDNESVEVTLSPALLGNGRLFIRVSAQFP
jgi:autotransporter-associated beta strand protein